MISKVYAIAIIVASAFFFIPDSHPSYSSTEEGMEQYPCPPLTPCVYDMMINGTSYPVLYSLYGAVDVFPEEMRLVGIEADLENKAISALVESTENGRFDITFDRNVTRALGLGRDADFIVLANGEQIERGIATHRGQTEDEDSTQIGVQFQEGSTHFLIGDPRVIPEFPVVHLIVVAALIVVVLVTHKNTLSQPIEKPVTRNSD